MWHRRIGHLKFENLTKVSKKEFLRDFPKIVKPLIQFVKLVNVGSKLNLASKKKNIQPHNQRLRKIKESAYVRVDDIKPRRIKIQDEDEDLQKNEGVYDKEEKKKKK